MKRILVPTDFSAPSKASLKFAIDLASRAGAEIHVMHASEVPFLPETTFGVQPFFADDEALQKVAEAANNAFEVMRRGLPSNVPICFKSINDSVVSAIRGYIDDNDIDLVVMSTHGASDIQDFFAGSTAEKIARFASVPVISVPKQIELAKIKNIIFPSDLRLDQNDLVNDLKELQQLLQAKLHVLVINTPQNFYSDQQAKNSLEKFASHYALQNYTLNFRCHQFERGGILEFMNELGGDMIAMGTHGRTGLAHFVKGSIAESILNRIDHPIWTWKLGKKKWA
ncbi:MAG: universal stress protein [Bacteroidota bacterium]